ncbi:globin domain-containing protein [Nocardioides sp. J54]|uniref:globin domain-containing protein n=1 Tax=Nocardioides sp. J54 TaxID=935866 RepID=UPI000490CADD|nr:globin domain-containing protein [Nocardioides sp. J54]
MLSPTSTEVIRATLPVVGAAIGEITPLFYSKMFAAHPELLRDTFNRGNQKAGDQPRALAASIARYATMLVDPATPEPAEMLSRIAHKHASLGVREDQYEVVHTHLFAAIVEVLGDAVTAEVAAAWDEVYWHMARDLIAIERGLYAAAGTDPEHVFRELVVAARTQESPDTVSFRLAAPDGTPLPAAQPGQYVSVGVRLPDGARQVRQYSLVRFGEDEWTITVKAVAARTSEDGTEIPEGEVSSFLHRNVFEGDTLQVSPPFGDLILDDSEAPLVLVSAGIGTTPIVGMLHHLKHSGSTRAVTVLHADRSPSHHALRRDLKELVGTIDGATLVRWYEDLGTRHPRADLAAGLIDLAAVDVPVGARAYLCGPLPFMESVHAGLVAKGVASDAIHYEVFGPDKWLAG